MPTAHSMRSFYTLMATQAVSMLGSHMTGFAIGVWLFVQTGSATPIALVAFFHLLPMILFSSVAGVIADRLPRKWLIIGSDAAQALPTLLLMLAFATQTFELWMLYLAVMVQACFQTLQMPAIEASITMLVPEAQRDRANGIRQIAEPAAGMLAPALAGVLYGLVGVVGVMMVDLLTFAVAVLIMLTQTIPQPRKSTASAAAQGSMWSEMKGAVRFLLERRALMLTILYATFLNFITTGAFVLITPYVIARTGSEVGAGVIQTLFSLGLVAGGLSTLVLPPPRNRMHVILPGLLLAGLGLMAFGMAQGLIVLAAIALLMTLPYKLTNALIHTLLQQKIPPDMHGRVFALTFQLAVLAMPLTLLITGPIVDQVLEPAAGQAAWWPLVAPLVGSTTGAGMGLYILLCGTLTTLGTLAVYALPSVRNLERELPDYRVEHNPLPQAAEHPTAAPLEASA